MAAERRPIGRRIHMKKMRMMTAAAVLAAMCLVTACGSSGYSSSAAKSEDAKESYGSYYEEPAAYAEEAAMEASSWDGDYSYDEAEVEELDYENGEAPEAIDAPVQLSADKLVYTCNLNLETTEYAETKAAIAEKIQAFGGIIESETESDNDYYWYYEDHRKDGGTLNLYLTVRVPSEQYSAFVAELEKVGKVTNKSQNVENISRRYHDTEARIEALEREEERLLEMMDKAEEIEDMIFIEERLTDVEAELSANKTDLATMDVDVRYSTINLSVKEVLVYTKDEPTPINFGQRFSETFKDSWRSFLSFMEGLLFVIVRLLPFLILAAVVVGIILYVRHKRDPRTPQQRRADRAALKAAKKEEARAKEEYKRQLKLSRAGQKAATRQAYQGSPQLQTPNAAPEQTSYTERPASMSGDANGKGPEA